MAYLVPLLLVQSRDDFFTRLSEYLLGVRLLLEQTLLCICLSLDPLPESTELVIRSLSLVNLGSQSARHSI